MREKLKLTIEVEAILLPETNLWDSGHIGNCDLLEKARRRTSEHNNGVCSVCSLLANVLRQPEVKVAKQDY